MIADDGFFGNLAGKHKDNDSDCERELMDAGIKVFKFESLRNKKDEVVTAVRGELAYWGFSRAWTYWVAEGPALPLDVATALHEKIGKEVRVEGHAGAPSPLEWSGGFGVSLYHVDSAAGLKALADAIKSVIAKAPKEYRSRFK